MLERSEASFEVEVRASPRGGRRLRGRFPYNTTATLSDGGRNGGRPKKERFSSRAFAYRVNAPDKEIHLLVGHDFDKPLASKLTDSLRLRDRDDALTFEADISPAIAETSYGRDVLAQIDAGLAYGISPGFRLPPPRRVARPETFEDEGHDPARGMFNALIRTINSALLYELSIVTRPAYKESEIEAVELTDDEKIAAGWTLQDGVLVPPERAETITRAWPAALRWR
jgi:HK97 family phage prohead protease